MLFHILWWFVRARNIFSMEFSLSVHVHISRDAIFCQLNVRLNEIQPECFASSRLVVLWTLMIVSCANSCSVRGSFSEHFLSPMAWRQFVCRVLVKHRRLVSRLGNTNFRFCVFLPNSVGLPATQGSVLMVKVSSFSAATDKTKSAYRNPVPTVKNTSPMRPHVFSFIERLHWWFHFNILPVMKKNQKLRLKNLIFTQKTVPRRSLKVRKAKKEENPAKSISDSFFSEDSNRKRLEWIQKGYYLCSINKRTREQHKIERFERAFEKCVNFISEIHKYLRQQWGPFLIVSFLMAFLSHYAVSQLGLPFYHSNGNCRQVKCAFIV